ncbi:hypothetical protein C8R45DRAFT_153715 [Mycena sanguinolenta]|nr:hypothetical protein C8R45DRAFT_153715 [Mycena sanguinolenta]
MLKKLPRGKKAETKDPLCRQLKNAFNLRDLLAFDKLKRDIRTIARKYINCSVTLGNQSPGTFDNIEQELMATFPKLRDEALGASRLQLSVLYIKSYFKSEIKRSRTRIEEQKTELKNAKARGISSSESTKSAVHTIPGRASSATPIAIPKADPLPTCTVSSSSSNNTTSMARLSDMAPEIKSFLESFNPSLLYLHPTFLEVGLVNQGALDALAGWPRSNIRDFLSELLEPTEEGHGKLNKVVVEAIVLRFKAHEYEY